METQKKCPTCKNQKPISDFVKNSRELKRCSRCRNSNNQSQQKYRLNNRDVILSRQKKHYINNKQQEILRVQKYKERIGTEVINEKRRSSYNKQKRHEKYLREKESVAKQNKEYRLNNLEKYRKYQREWTKEKRKTNPHYTIQHRLRNRLLVALKRGKGQKSLKFIELVGCSFEYLKLYIEKQFTEGMSWDKFFLGEIVIDHIKPCCSFDLTKESEQKACFHYTNLRPLWKTDNATKISSDLKQKLS